MRQSHRLLQQHLQMTPLPMQHLPMYHHRHHQYQGGNPIIITATQLMPMLPVHRQLLQKMRQLQRHRRLLLLPQWQWMTTTCHLGLRTSALHRGLRVVGKP